MPLRSFALAWLVPASPLLGCLGSLGCLAMAWRLPCWLGFGKGSKAEGAVARLAEPVWWHFDFFLAERRLGGKRWAGCPVGLDPGHFSPLNMLNNCPAGPPESALGPNFNATASGVSGWGQGGQEGEREGVAGGAFSVGPQKGGRRISHCSQSIVRQLAGLCARNGTNQPEAALYYAAQPRLRLTEGRAGSSATNCIFAVHVCAMEVCSGYARNTRMPADSCGQAGDRQGPGRQTAGSARAGIKKRIKRMDTNTQGVRGSSVGSLVSQLVNNKHLHTGQITNLGIVLPVRPRQ